MLGIRFEDFSALGGVSTGGMGVGALSATAVLTEPDTAAFRVGGVEGTGNLVAEVVHAEGADVVASFASGPSATGPAVTRHRHGDGEAWYVATVPDAAGADAIVDALLQASGVEPVVADLPAGVEAARRGDLVTLINHGDTAVSVAVSGTDAESGAPLESIALAPQGVAFVRVPVLATVSATL